MHGRLNGFHDLCVGIEVVYCFRLSFLLLSGVPKEFSHHDLVGSSVAVQGVSVPISNAACFAQPVDKDQEVFAGFQDASRQALLTGVEQRWHTETPCHRQYFSLLDKQVVRRRSDQKSSPNDSRRILAAAVLSKDLV
jgi:hypothetical protein